MKQSCPTRTMWRHLLHYPLIKKSVFAHEHGSVKNSQISIRIQRLGSVR